MSRLEDRPGQVWIVRGLDPALLTLAHEGSRVYHDRFDLLYRREASHPNEICQADHTLLDSRSSTNAAAPLARG